MTCVYKREKIPKKINTQQIAPCSRKVPVWGQNKEHFIRKEGKYSGDRNRKYCEKESHKEQYLGGNCGQEGKEQCGQEKGGKCQKLTFLEQSKTTRSKGSQRFRSNTSVLNPTGEDVLGNAHEGEEGL